MNTTQTKHKSVWFFNNTKHILIFISIVIGLSINYSVITGSFWQVVVYRFTQNYIGSLICLLIAYFAVICYEKGLGKKDSLFLKSAKIVFSCFFSVSFIFGVNFSLNGNLDAVFSNKTDCILSLLSLLSWSFVLYQLVSLIVYSFSDIKIHGKTNRMTVKKMVLSFMVLLMYWTPWYIINWPGVINYDGAEQLSEFFGYSVDGGLHFVLTNHHPLLTTLLEVGSINIGKDIFGSFNVGISIYTAIQLVILSLAVIFVCQTIDKFFGYKQSCFLFLFFLLFPCFSMWGVTLDKTGLFLAAVLFFVASLLRIDVKTSLTLFDYLMIGISSISLILIRNDAILYVSVAMIGSCFLRIKTRKQVIITFLTAIVSSLIISKIMMSTFQAIPTEPSEDLGVPIQQIARVVKYNRHSITSNERSILNDFFYVDKMPSLYNQYFFDPTKAYAVKWPYYKFKGNYNARLRMFNSQPISHDKFKLLKVWFDIGKDNPKLYLEAFVAETVNYYCPYITNEGQIFQWNAGTDRGYDQLHRVVYQQYNPMFPKVQLWAGKAVKQLGSYVPFNILFSCCTWSFISLLLTIMLIEKFKQKYLNIALVTIVIVFIPFIGPVNGTFKYYLPLLITTPVMLIALCSTEKK